VFARCGSAVTSMASSDIVFRHCIFDRNMYAYMGYGGDRVAPDVLDHCLFWFSGGEFRGANAYFTRPMTIRYCLFVESTPHSPGITAYTSKPNRFSGVKIIGNTMLHASSCITNTARSVVIRDNVCLGSRFLSNSGADVTVRNNIAVYDPSDLKRYPKIPRRNIGFRAYAQGFTFTGNTLVGFAQGGNVYATTPAGKKTLTGNRFYGFTAYGLRLFQMEGLTCDDNVYASASDKAPCVRDTPSRQQKHDLTLETWRQRGHGQRSRVQAKAPRPALPRVLVEAMRRGTRRMPPR